MINQAWPYIKKIIITFFLFICLYQKTAYCQIIDSIHYEWTVYEYDEDSDNKKCYIASFAKDSKTSYTAVRNPYLTITRFSQSRLEEVSINSGYDYKGNSGVYILIRGEQYRLFTKKNMAWFENDFDDKMIIQKLLTADIIKVRSDSDTGNYAVDEYSMKGFTRAYQRMKELCQ